MSDQRKDQVVEQCCCPQDIVGFLKKFVDYVRSKVGYNQDTLLTLLVVGAVVYLLLQPKQ